MEPVRLFFFFVFLLSTLHLSRSNSCEIYKFVASENQALEGHVIKTVARSLVAVCWSECVWLSWCMSINVRTNHGAVECDLNNSSRRANPRKMVTTKGSQYQQMEAVDDQNCSMYDCKRKEDLGDGWFRHGEAAIKLFQQFKNWTAARTVCQSLGGDLLSITSSHENDFVYDVFVKELNLTYGERLAEMNPPDVYWKFNGYEPGVSFAGTPGGVRYQPDDGENALHFTGVGGYAEAPSVALDLSNFTITLWLKGEPQSADYPTAFSGASSEIRLQLLITDRNQGTCLSMKTYAYSPSSHSHQTRVCGCPLNHWCHFSFAWNSTDSMYRVLLNGHQETTEYPTTLNMRGATVIPLRLGNNKLKNQPYNGSIKHFMIFKTLISIQEMQTAMYWHEPGQAWIGLNGQANTNTFQWSDDTPVSQFRPLPDYNPTPVLSGRKCVAMRSNRKWLDKHCLEKKNFICERPAP